MHPIYNITGSPGLMDKLGIYLPRFISGYTPLRAGILDASKSCRIIHVMKQDRHSSIDQQTTPKLRILSDPINT